ncbi:MAG: phage/plasmid primase, P4 family [Planctomycetaceae bacterium]
MSPTENRRRLNSAGTATQEVLQLTIDKKKIRLEPVSLLEENLFQELYGLIATATAVSITSWASVLSLPQEAQNNLLRLLSVVGLKYKIRIVGNRTIYHDVFAATLALTVDASDLRQVAEANDLATSAAALCHPGAIRPAAEQIKNWLTQHRIAADRTDVIAGRIRKQFGSPCSTNRLTPQQACLDVLAEWQQEREFRGEDTSTSPPVRYWNEDWYRWNGRYWEFAADLKLEMLRMLQSSTERDLSTQFMSATEMNIAAKTVVKKKGLRLPVFIEGDSIEPRHAIVLRNGVIDLSEMLRTEQLPVLQPHDPRLFATSSLPYDYSPQAECPLWLETLDDICPRLDDADRRIQIVQEFFGDCLMPWDMSFETFAIFVGNGGNGKSTILNGLTHVLGTENVSNVLLEGFTKDAHLFELSGKLANVASEIHRLPRVEEATLKALVSGEPRQVDRKYKRPVTMFPTAKLVFGTNHLPPFSDTSHGLWRRMLLVPFRRRFVGELCELARKQRILDELPGILVWALKGALRLMSQGGFSQCVVCDRARDEYRHDSDVFLQFVDECCELVPDHDILTRDLYAAYREFAIECGRQPKGSSEFGRQVLNLAGVTKDRASTGTRRPWRYIGVRLRTYVLGAHRNLDVGTAPRSVLAD